MLVGECCFHHVMSMIDRIADKRYRFYNDHGRYAGFGGIAFKKDEGTHIAEALGDTKAVILAMHGHLTVAKTVDGAAFLFGAMDRCMQAQLMADAAAGGRGTETIKATPEVAQYTRNLYTDEMTYIMFQSGKPLL